MGKRLGDFWLGIDLRSLALFRIVLAVVLIGDWFDRWPDLEAFYTSDGIVPIEAPLPRVGGAFHFSLLDGVTSLPMVRLAFLFGLACYVLLLIGYRTKLAHVLSLLFLISVLTRNGLTRHGGDSALLTLLFWSVLLPLGRRFSVDAALAALRGARPPGHELPNAYGPSFAAFAIILQIAVIYLLTAVDKSGRSWRDGTALYYVLQIDHFTTPLGHWLGGQSLGVLKVLTYATLVIEYAIAPLILLPWPQPLLRRIAIALIALFHLGTWATMTLGSFPWAMMCTIPLLLREQDWTLIRRWSYRWSHPVLVYYDGGCPFCRWCCRLFAIADGVGNLRFVDNRNSAAFEHELQKAETDVTVVTYDLRTGRKAVRMRSVAVIARALPLPFWVLRLLDLPLVRRLGDAVYDVIARNRPTLSSWVGPMSDEIRPTATAPMCAVPDDGRLTPRRLLGAVCVTALLFVVGLNTYNTNLAQTPRAKIDEPAWVRAIIGATGLITDWHLFAPDPMRDDGWWVIDGITEDGRRIDPLTGEPPTFEKPPDLSRRFDCHWRKVLHRLWYRDHSQYRLYFARYLTGRDHRASERGKRLSRFEFYYVVEWTPELDASGGVPPASRNFPVKRELLWSHDCFAPD